MHTQSHTTRLFRLLGVLFSLFGPIGSAAAQDKPIRIGEINSYSGVATVYTFPYKEGLTLATKEINDAGGVLGRPLEFIHRDDKLKPDEAVKAARNRLIGVRVIDADKIHPAPLEHDGNKCDGTRQPIQLC